MNRGFANLQPYPFERLAALRGRVSGAAAADPINLSIGEPQRATPALITNALIAALDGTARYPATRGSRELREAMVRWATRRFGLPAGSLHAEHNVLPVNGTREALFAIAQTVVDARADGVLVGMPNPFYQIYEGAALLAGATPCLLPCPAGRDFRPDFAAVPAAAWADMAMVYVCSPGNPSGAVLEPADYARLIALADRHDFVVVADECYSELYHDERAPPLGLLEWCAANGRSGFERCLVMHSLSKRSNAPGLRSGFVAGDAALIETFYRYRTYQGGAMPLHVQHASAAAWDDETHVIENRAAYRRVFERVTAILGEVLPVSTPPAGFYLWPQLPVDGVTACERLLGEAGVLVLPGEFLAREVDGVNPGRDRVRIALVASEERCVEAAERMRDLFRTLTGGPS